MYIITGVKGRDLYDHSQSRIGFQEAINLEDVEPYFDLKKAEYTKALAEKTIPWAYLYVVAVTVDGMTVVKHWGDKIEQLSRTQINAAAKKASAKKPATIQEALNAMAAFDPAAANVTIPSSFWATVNTQGTPEIVETFE